MYIHQHVTVDGVTVPFVYKAMLKVACSSMLRAIHLKLGLPKRSPGYLNLNWRKVKLSDLPTIDAFKFSFVRNPWDRLVSCWANRAKKYKFEWYVNRVIKLKTSDPHSTPQWPHLYVDGKLLFDFVGRFERLQHDWRLLQQRFQFPDLDCVNATQHRHYSTYYTPMLRDAVGEHYRKDIELFGYKFEDGEPHGRIT